MTELTIFVLDSCILTRISTKRQISANPKFKVIGDFKCAKDCLKALEKQNPDIILCDLELCDMDGLDFCRIIKEGYPKIKTIILTTAKDDLKILASLSCGASGYSIKGKTDIKNVIEVVSRGTFFIDLELAKNAFSKIPILNTKNLDNLYKYKELKQSLTQRELEVLKHIIEGKTNSQIAHDIYVSTNTIKAHVGSILEKFGAKDRVQAAVMAVKADLF